MPAAPTCKQQPVRKNPSRPCPSQPGPNLLSPTLRLWSSERSCRLLPCLAPDSVTRYAATGPWPSEPVAPRHGCAEGAGEDYIVRFGSLEKKRQSETIAGTHHAMTSHIILLVSLPPCASNKVNTKNLLDSYTSHVTYSSCI